MHFFYSIFIQLFGFAIHLVANFNLKARNWLKGRENWKEKLKKKINISEKYGWIHCSSAGEFEQAIPIINELRFKVPDLRIAVSFFSSSGFEMYKDSGLADLFFYFPLDTKKKSKYLIEILKPNFAIFIRNEIWLNILTYLNQKEIPVFLVNANLSQKRNFFYQKYLNYSYSLFTKIFDTKHYGNTKLERVSENKNVVFRDEILEDFCKDSLVIILGSSWLEEERFTFDFYKKFSKKDSTLKIIIAPHEYIENSKNKILKKIKDWQTHNNIEAISYSKYKLHNTQYSILFLDKKGILKYAYKYADIAVIGGGFGKGVHNITEAAIYGIPTIFGSNYSKFEEINDLVKLNLAFPIKDYVSYKKKMLELIEDTELRKSTNVRLKEYFIQHKKTSSLITKDVLAYLK